ncbi:hypothetical protein B0H13DRAFT_2332756 [Mycena leptocephala]|nr:hypothetical protein B0H13DRAFT_2332756 [Mycena leptocephala]
MSLKDELKLWQTARNAFDAGNYEKSLELFGRIPPSATASTNMGLICSAMGDHQKALRRLTDATTRDPSLTIAYFQRGVSHFLLERYRPAGRDFKRAWLSLPRGNEAINHEQLGLRFRLFASEVLFNLGLSRIRLGRMEKGMEYLEKAKLLTMIEDHDVIEDVILHKGEGFPVFSIVRVYPLIATYSFVLQMFFSRYSYILQAPGILYWPSDTKLMGIERKDFMGKATLIAASDPDDLTTGFSGLQLKQQRRQKNLNRQSEAVIARRVTFMSIRASLSPFTLTFISIAEFLFCRIDSLASHLTPSAAAPSVPPSILVTDASTDTNASKALPPRPLVDPLVWRNQRTVPVPVDTELRLP